MSRISKWLKDVFNLIDVTPVVVVHYRRVLDDSPLPAADLFVLLGIPLILAGLGYQYPTTDSLLSRIIPALAILIGFSVNAIILMAQQPLRQGESETREEYTETQRRGKALKHTRTNTLYALIIGLISLLVSLVVSVVSQTSQSILVWGILSSILYFFLAHYFITLIMISRRLYILVEKDTFAD